MRRVIMAITRRVATPCQAPLDLVQALQRVGGNMTTMGKALPLLGPALSGVNLSFSFIHVDGALRSIRGKFDGDSFEGFMRLDGHETPVSGRRAARAIAARAGEAALKSSLRWGSPP